MSGSYLWEAAVVFTVTTVVAFLFFYGLFSVISHYRDLAKERRRMRAIIAARVEMVEREKRMEGWDG